MAAPTEQPIPPDAIGRDDAVEVLSALRARRIQYAMVLADDAIIGVVGQAELESLIRFRNAGGDAPVGRPPI